jgi:hypothetical protein
MTLREVEGLSLKDLEIEVTNTRVNRSAGDAGKPQEQRATFAGAGGSGGGGGAAGGART